MNVILDTLHEFESWTIFMHVLALISEDGAKHLIIPYSWLVLWIRGKMEGRWLWEKWQNLLNLLTRAELARKHVNQDGMRELGGGFKSFLFTPYLRELIQKCKGLQFTHYFPLSIKPEWSIEASKCWRWSIFWVISHDSVILSDQQNHDVWWGVATSS